MDDLGIRPARHLRLRLANGVSNVDSDAAAAASYAFGKEMRDLRDAGVKENHSFLAVPAALALLVVEDYRE